MKLCMIGTGYVGLVSGVSFSDLGNTVLIIEHNLDIIKVSDYIVDLGPEGGKNGGTIMAKGTPEQVAKNKESHTARYLKKELEDGR